MKKGFVVTSILTMLLCMAGCGAKNVNSLTYAVFSYLPDAGYYQELIEKRWAEVEPDIPLVRADWDCYTDGAPQYLMLARRSAYQKLDDQFPLYVRLEELAGDKQNHAIVN